MEHRAVGSERVAPLSDHHLRDIEAGRRGREALGDDLETGETMVGALDPEPRCPLRLEQPNALERLRRLTRDRLDEPAILLGGNPDARDEQGADRGARDNEGDDRE